MILKKAIHFKERSSNVIKFFRVVRLCVQKLSYFTRNKSNFTKLDEHENSNFSNKITLGDNSSNLNLKKLSFKSCLLISYH